jgi:hypothetical protein
MTLFQGTERDIIFLSMVADPEHRTALTMLRYEQRFSVAVSRARDRGARKLAPLRHLRLEVPSSARVFGLAGSLAVMSSACAALQLWPFFIVGHIKEALSRVFQIVSIFHRIVWRNSVCIPCTPRTGQWAGERDRAANLPLESGSLLPQQSSSVSKVGKGPMTAVLITGANRGLGFEFSSQYVADGWRVFAACRDPATASELQRLAQNSKNMVSTLPASTGQQSSSGAVRCSRTCAR